MLDSTQTGQLRTRADEIHTLLQDVRSWLTENLSASTHGSCTQACQTTTQNNREEPAYPYFELYEWAEREVLVCSLASFALSQGKGGRTQTSLFACNCPNTSPNIASPHSTRLEAYQCESPFLSYL